MSFYRNALEDWLATIDVNAHKVLDIGGSQLSIKGRTKSFEAKELLILDLETPHQGDKPNIICDLNYSIVNKIDKKYKEVFDIIFCLEVSEYLFDPLTALKNIYSLLKLGGILYISFCSIYPVHNPKEADCLRYTKEGIIKLLKESGFAKWEITPRVATAGILPLGDFYRLEGMHPVRHDDAIFDIGYMVKVYK